MHEPHYRQRIQHLRSKYNDTRPVDPASEADLLSFVQNHPQGRKAFTALTRHGHLRLIWKDREEPETYLALTFQGHQDVQYAIFRRLPGAAAVTHAAGTEHITEVDTLAADYRITHLLQPA